MNGELALDGDTGAVTAFIHALREQVIEQAQIGNPSWEEIVCLAHAAAELFDDSGVLETPVVCHATGRLGRSEWELAGWAMPSDDDDGLGEVSVLTAEWIGTDEAPLLGLPEVRRLFDRAVQLIRGALEGRTSDVVGPAEIQEFASELSRVGTRSRRITVHVVTDGTIRRGTAVEPMKIGGVEVRCELWDGERLGRLTDPTQKEILVDIGAALDGRGLAAMEVPTPGVPYDAFLCIVPGVVLCKAYDQYGQRLLELNVRAFLSQKGKVNQGIRDTILSGPEQFFPYNNGLALIARDVDVRRGESGGAEIMRIRGLQIVNGGQTTASLHRAWKVDGAVEQVDRTFVQAKLIVIRTTPEDDAGFVDLVRSISRYANSQNAVKADDLEANQPWHVVLEQLSRSTWTPDASSKWFYERSRGSYAVAKAASGSTRKNRLEFERMWPRSQMFTKSDLAKSINAWGQRPDTVSLGGQKNFTAFIRSLDDQLKRPTLDESTFRRIVGKLILFQDATRIVRDLKDEIPAYRANVVAYLVSYLSHRTQGGLDFDKIWDKQATPIPVQDELRRWAAPIARRILETAGTRNVTEWCKKSECWTAVRALDLPISDALGRYVTPGGVTHEGVLPDSSDAIDVSECMRMSPDEWNTFQDWAFKNPVHFKIRGIIQTLRLQALNGWARNPTVRQARPVATVIRRWRSEAVGDP